MNLLIEDLEASEDPEAGIEDEFKLKNHPVNLHSRLFSIIIMDISHFAFRPSSSSSLPSPTLRSLTSAFDDY